MNPSFKSIYAYIGFLMSLIIMALGIIFLTTHYLADSIPPQYRTALGVIFIIYAIFRGIRSWQQLKRIKQDEK